MTYSDQHWTAVCPDCNEELEKQTIPSMKNEYPWVCNNCGLDIAEAKWVHNE